MQIQLASEIIDLHPSGAIFWPSKKVLFIADVHLGKIEHFRKNGSPIPPEASKKNTEKLSKVIAFYSPQEVVFLGDLFHSASNSSWFLFETWVKQQKKINFSLVVGNHDIIARTKFENIGIRLLDIWESKPFLGTHYPTEKEGFFNLCGHIHPGFLLKGEGKQYLKLACFHQRKNQLILPAFGSFTGKFIVQPSEHEKVYLIGGEQVFSLEG